jgi:hypothetical protein
MSNKSKFKANLARMLSLALVGFASMPVLAEETCEVMRKVNGVLKGVQVPCSQLRQHMSPEQRAARDMQEEERAERQRKCGKDFEALRIGMSFERYEECTEEPSLIGEAVTKDGMIENYRGTFYLIRVQNGRIVGYTRR